GMKNVQDFLSYLLTRTTTVVGDLLQQDRHDDRRSAAAVGRVTIGSTIERFRLP
ncbi:hypothetical protein HAX54_018163, partial [Datura stramonium]|nr:hypothetical protein [Datura stramonium]